MTQFVNEKAYGKGQSYLSMFLKQQDVGHIIPGSLTQPVSDELGSDITIARDYV